MLKLKKTYLFLLIKVLSLLQIFLTYGNPQTVNVHLMTTVYVC